MIANPSLSHLRNRERRPAYCRVNLTPTRSLTRYSIGARQVRNCIALGCVSGLIFVVVACWAVDYFTL